MKINNETIKRAAEKGASIKEISDRMGINKQTFYARQWSGSWRTESVMAFCMVAGKITGDVFEFDDVVE